MFETKGVKLKEPTRAAVLRMLKAKGDARMLKANGDARMLEDVVDQALLAWLLKNTCEDYPAAHAAARGYQWKSLFLPEGTLVRFDYRRQSYHAAVQGDHIVYEGRAYSPRQLLLHLTGTVRNAWHELWLRSPGDARWHLANTRRRILRRTPRAVQPVNPLWWRLDLHRGDTVRDDQPDLECRLGGGGPARAGRWGKRDRRAGANIFALPLPST